MIKTNLAAIRHEDMSLPAIVFALLRCSIVCEVVRESSILTAARSFILYLFKM